MDPILIPPGKTQNWNCPNGSTLKVGDIISSTINEKPTPVFVILKSDGKNLVLGPLSAGNFEVSNLCSESAVLAFSIEAPDPAKVEKKIQPLSPVELAYPWWVWLVLVLAVALFGFMAWGLRRLLAAKPADTLAASRVRLRKSPVEKMELFLSKIDQQNTVEKPDAASAQLLYGEGIKHLRSVIQVAYKFKAPGATTTEFVSELKAQALTHKSLLSPAQISQLESIFMQAKQVTYARETPELVLRKAFLKSLKDFTDHLKARILASAPAPVSKRPIFKRTPKS